MPKPRRSETAEHPVDFFEHLVATPPAVEDRALLCEVMRAHWAPRPERVPSCPGS